MSLSKLLGADAKPIGTAVQSYLPKSVTKAVLSMLEGFMGTCQYPLSRSSVANHFAPDNASNIPSIRGRGKALGTATALNIL